MIFLEQIGRKLIRILVNNMSSDIIQDIYTNGHMSRIQQYNNSTIPQPQQIKKIFCAYHPNQFLTNFCCDQECLMPLCPNCIVQHTQQHFLQNNKPSYVNLSDALNETKQRCYQNIVIFEELNKANDKIYDYIVGLRESIHNQLMQDKQQIFKEIEVLFDNFEEKLMNDTLAKYKDLQVYDRKQTVNITEFITEQIEVIHDQIGILKGQNCLAGLINFYKNDSKIYEESIKEIGEYIGKHRKAGKISINSDQEALSRTLENFCQTNLQVEFISQDAKEKQEEQKMKSSVLSREASNKTFTHKFRQASSYGEKENHLSQSNQDYGNIVKRSEEYYKIDPIQLKQNKSQASFAGLPPPYYNKQVGTRHRY